MTEIKILLEKQPDEDYYDSSNYELESIIKIDTDANATEYISAVCKAMQIEEYSTESIANAMYNYSQYLANKYRFELKDDD